MQIATLENHTGNVTAVAFHCEGKWLATGSEDGTIKIWDMRYVRTPNYTPRNGMLTSAAWFYRTSGTQREYSHNSAVNDVVVHPNQGELISCDQNGSVKIWDLGEDSCTHELVSIKGARIGFSRS